ncbi:hypothetical protein FOXYSP1_20320 [Fusarium oxysporum f. sp. phaseoli]
MYGSDQNRTPSGFRQKVCGNESGGGWWGKYRFTRQEEEGKIKELVKAGWAVRIATSSSARNGLAIRIPISAARAGKTNETFSVTLASRERHSPYTEQRLLMASALCQRSNIELL